eukprot:1064219_1
MAETVAERSSSTMGQDQKRFRPDYGILALTAIGVGAVISGDFFGWNFGLDRGGFGGLLIATIFVGFMYVCVSFSLAELAGMYPSAEGAFAFSRQAFGPFAGFLCGLSESLEYVLLVPVIITGLGDQLNVLFGITNPDVQVIWWSVLCIFFLVIHISGAGPTFHMNTVVCTLSLLALVLYWCACLSAIDGSGTILNIPPDADYSGSSEFLPKGVYGIFASLVFASWFFIAVEELPLSGEDAKDPTKNIPKALQYSIVILTVTALATLFLSVLVPGGAYNIANTGAPLTRALIAGLSNSCVKLNDPLASNAKEICNSSPLKCQYNEDEGTCWDTELSNSVIAWEVVINFGTFLGLLNSCHAIIYAGGRQLYSLTRNGIFPACPTRARHFGVLSDIKCCCHKETQHVNVWALVADIALSYLITIIVYLIGEGVDFLVGLSVAAACLSYILSMCSFIKLRKTKSIEQFPRPYQSSFGIFGAGYAVVMSFLVMVSFFVDVGVGLGAVMCVVVLVAFLFIYALLAIEFHYGCCGNKGGRDRFEEYVAVTLSEKEEKEDGRTTEINTKNEEAETLKNDL